MLAENEIHNRDIISTGSDSNAERIRTEIKILRNPQIQQEECEAVDEIMGECEDDDEDNYRNEIFENPLLKEGGGLEGGS